MSIKDTSLRQQIALAGAALSSLVVFLSLKYHDRPLFRKRIEGIPNVKGYPLVGNLPSILKHGERFYDYNVELFESHDTLTLAYPAAGIPETITTIDPQNIEYILKTNFYNYVKGPQAKAFLYDLLGYGIFNANGDKWKYQRKTASHIFNVKNFRDQFTDVFVKEMHVMFDNILEKASIEGTVIDFHDVMFRFTLDSFVYLGFGIQLDTLLNKEKAPFAVSFDFLQRLSAERFIDPLMGIKEGLVNLFCSKEKTTRYNVSRVDSFAQQVIEQRRKEMKEGKTDHKDLLSRFMNATNECGEMLSDRELRDNVLNFIIAGRDTTAQAVSWLFYCISQHPQVEQKMLQEIEKNITDEIERDSPALFYETLRLYPVVSSNQKYAVHDDVLPDGTHVKAGTYVGWLSYAQGRSKRIWGEDAKEFIPERWIDENGKLRREPAAKWSAFHVGPRVCLGQNLATLEALVCIIMILRRYSFKLVENQTITYSLALTLPMKHGLKMTIGKR
ncbi:hypothetical protein RO3G_12103 [Rhizopus delemar RA 99-880]|uniref:Cytochrome P450 n=1 Tax=Rhizopus delemar (strain RA 99-880 / ATCC MYA-4621 / FGSC 9543 / NRRL 43880) TaxID=246409 RepID=I1CG12_RHIO9|nr:hypothetical protein RO3G_12103 [Rhizopus delemar RA 99-880]|eukprot:EIE87392.1 hypothetical protein RO3G_12103 [Rhizopus delemar RA 99-880]